MHGLAKLSSVTAVATRTTLLTRESRRIGSGSPECNGWRLAGAWLQLGVRHTAGQAVEQGSHRD
jgi:hypothetical protein